LLFQTSLGIDMGEDLLSVVCLRASLKGFRLAAQAGLSLEKEMSLDEKVSLIGQFVPEFLKQNRIVPSMVFLGIPRRYAVLKYIQLPVAVKENLRNALGYEMEKYVPLPVEDIYFDFQIIREDRETGMMRLLLVAVKKETLSLFLPMAKEMRSGISGIEVRSTATANCFAGRIGGMDLNGSAFIHLNDSSMDVGFLEGGRLDYIKEVPLSSKAPDSADVIAHELRLLSQRMGQENGTLNAILCASEGEKLLERLNGERGWLDVRLADLSRTGLASCRDVPAYGLALKAFQNPPTDINLLPPRLRKRASRASYYVMVCLGVFSVLLLLVWGGGNILKHRLALDRVNAELKTLSATIAEIERDREGCKQLEKRLDALNALWAGPSVLEVLKELSERLPDTAWVIGFTFSDKGVELEGEADSASELIPLLDASPVFRDVVFLSTITKTREGKDRFRIGLKFS
jgi:Tfp pilus assembly protein PilN